MIVVQNTIFVMNKLVQIEDNQEPYLNPIYHKIRHKKTRTDKSNITFNQRQRNGSQDIQINVKDPEVHHLNIIQNNLHKSQNKLQPVIKKNIVLNNNNANVKQQNKRQENHYQKSLIIEIQNHNIPLNSPYGIDLSFDTFQQKPSINIPHKLKNIEKTIDNSDGLINNRKDMLLHLKNIKQRLNKIDIEKICIDLQRFKPSQNK